MTNFIEVHNTSGKKLLINVSCIENVFDFGEKGVLITYLKNDKRTELPTMNYKEVFALLEASPEVLINYQN